MHPCGERLRFTAVPRITKVCERRGSGPNVLAVKINFRWRVNARVGYLESQQRRERLGFDWELECSALLGLSVNPYCFCRERCCNSSKILNVLRRRVQRWHR